MTAIRVCCKLFHPLYNGQGVVLSQLADINRILRKLCLHNKHNIQIQPGLKAKLSLIYSQFTLRKRKKSLMLNDDNNENGIKKINTSNQQKKQFRTCSTLFVHFFAVVLHDYNFLVPETSQLLRALLRKCRMYSCPHFFTAAHLIALSFPHLLI